MNLNFEWDEEKAEANIRKHGISFETAAKVFLDENRVEIYDTAHSEIEEDRFITIGMADEVLFVVYTERQPNIRLISARLANTRERRLYYGIV
ncbi:MAG: BrnT family toxin [Lachnospiraceae bacterium]|nr:BrnT family toxin [Lachnospiraceae bacterium]MDE6220432.1 BrnT family toxin [Lachnospiraceae bacterium]